MTTAGAETPEAEQPPALARSLAEAEFDILPEFLELVLEPALGVLKLLDAAVRLAELLLEPVDPEDERRGLASSATAAPGTSAGGATCAGWLR